MSQHSEQIIRISRKTVENSNGFSLDIGGSAVKLTYRHKDDWAELQNQGQDTDTAKIRLRIFAKEDLADALDFLSKYCHISREDDQCPQVLVTGLGGHYYTELIEKKLQVGVQITAEISCFAKAFEELARTLPQEDFEYTNTEERRDELRLIMVRWRDQRANINSDMDEGRRAERHIKAKSFYLRSNVTPASLGRPIATNIPQLYPCLMYIVSSASGFIKLYSETEHDMFGLNLSGGAVFLGLGNMLCRSKKSYDDLIDLAEKGDCAAVDETWGCYKSAGTQPKNEYSIMADQTLCADETIYPFRKALSDPSAPYKDEDVIMSLLKTIVRYHANVVVFATQSTNIPHVFLNGSFFNRQLVRKLFEEEFYRQIVFGPNWNDDGKDTEPQIHFVKTGAYLGSIGAFMNSTKTPSGK